MRTITRTIKGQEVTFGPGAQLGLLEMSGVRLPKRCDLTGAMLKESSLTDAKLRGVNFSKADMRGTALRGSDLRGANLVGADLRGAQLGVADLRGAKLGGFGTGAKTHETSFYQARLDHADLRGCDLRYAWTTFNKTIASANVEGALLSPAAFVVLDVHEWALAENGRVCRPWHYVEKAAKRAGLDIDIARMFFKDRPGITVEEILSLGAALQRATQH